MYFLITNSIETILPLVAVLSYFHCVKSVCVRSYSGPHFPAFRLNTERYGVSLRIQSECGKMWTRITPNSDTSHAVFGSRYKVVRGYTPGYRT